MTEPAQEGTRRPRTGRSPSYPGIPLGDAIERAKVVYEHEKKNPAPVAVVMKHWGYNNPKSGRASVTFAALKKFGLITEDGSNNNRVARLTDRVVEILHNPDPRKTIQEAALLPPIHRELWDEYKGSLPSGDNLTWTLIKRGFTPTGAAEFIRQFRETIAYAQLTDAATIDTGSAGGEEEVGDDDEQHDEPGEQNQRRRQPRKRFMSENTLSIPVPIIGGEAVIVEGQFPITEAAWAQFMAVLNAMKPGLVQQPATDDSE